ncbi:hypothetical protein BBP40_010943 [Aspergillus hancockii]|nr:hypothetical protein BBP40_010943 [Aspergillus hancockii]
MSAEIRHFSPGPNPFLHTGSASLYLSPSSAAISSSLPRSRNNQLPIFSPPGALTPFTSPDLPPNNTQASNDQQHGSMTERGRPRSKQQKDAVLLERNRVAANKCRKKKKAHTDQLKECFLAAKRKKQYLEVEVDQLQREILILKNQMLRHWQCDNEAIKDYLSQMFTRVTRKAGLADPANPPLANDNGSRLQLYPVQFPQEKLFDCNSIPSGLPGLPVEIEQTSWDPAPSTIDDTSAWMLDDIMTSNIMEDVVDLT